jgi:ProQ/FINO family
MGPHPGRKKLIVRSFEPKPSRYAEKAAAKLELKPHQSDVKYRDAALKAEPKIRVPGPGVDRKPGLSVAEQRQRKRARLAALAWLKVAYPPLFGYPPRPLAIGIGKLIWAAAKDAGVKRNDLGAALHYHVHRQAYLAALAADGAMRFGLDGEPVGPVEPEHRTEALKLLAVIAEIKERHSAPVDREGCQIASPSL